MFKKYAKATMQPIPAMVVATAAYIAGLIDGEGCIGIYAKKPSGTRTVVYHQLLVTVGMREEGAVAFLAEATAAYRATKTHRLISTGQVHEWKLTGPRAAEFLRAVLPYLIVKRRQAEVAIEFYETCSFSKGNASVTPDVLARREAYGATLKQLKRAVA